MECLRAVDQKSEDEAVRLLRLPRWWVGRAATMIWVTFTWAATALKVSVVSGISVDARNQRISDTGLIGTCGSHVHVFATTNHGREVTDSPKPASLYASSPTQQLCLGHHNPRQATNVATHGRNDWTVYVHHVFSATRVSWLLHAMRAQHQCVWKYNYAGVCINTTTYTTITHMK
jgi:hypothetical protein